MTGDFIEKPISAKQFVLATDLDGTFLGGSETDRRKLYDWIEANRDTVGLIFVTGRDPMFIEDMCGDGLPWPDYAIGDVGTTIAQIVDRKVTPLPGLESEISRRWADSGARVRAALTGMAGLTEQPTPFRYRVSFDLDPAALDPQAESLINEMGLDVLISDNRFFDVLPGGISKGPSLRLLADHLGIAHGRVLAAGDTMNDLSMLTLGLPAVAVGGSEAELLSRVDGLQHVHKSDAIGAAGILDAIRVLELHPSL
ncbi:HAD family hydrolase [Oceaniovalibus sp. ACAM 378]|uniref:HAD family hydrolase n=1 Tax=Oceaniovalibus sp. ACAM 378 TaxID=2599923 RepID=UPI0011D78E76|nr:HAD family hydrolase [Oceaniovalibus sp. ACAM 378]TYB85058.1 HAD hydrolase family protein [Oceaniovalibus sp. ACAM 378]